MHLLLAHHIKQWNVTTRKIGQPKTMPLNLHIIICTLSYSDNDNKIGYFHSCVIQGFKTLNRALQVTQDHPDYIQPESFQQFARSWGKLFMELFFDDDLTPYIHGMKIYFCKYHYLLSHKQIHIQTVLSLSSDGWGNFMTIFSYLI